MPMSPMCRTGTGVQYQYKVQFTGRRSKIFLFTRPSNLLKKSSIHTSQPSFCTTPRYSSTLSPVLPTSCSTILKHLGIPRDSDSIAEGDHISPPSFTTSAFPTSHTLWRIFPCEFWCRIDVLSICCLAMVTQQPRRYHLLTISSSDPLLRL